MRWTQFRAAATQTSTGTTRQWAAVNE